MQPARSIRTLNHLIAHTYCGHKTPYIISEGNLIGGNYGSVTFGGQNTAVSGFSIAAIMGGFVYYNGPTQTNASGVANSYFYALKY